MISGSRRVRVPEKPILVTNLPGPHLLFPPGIGDCHWILLKMQAMVKKDFAGTKPMVWVCTHDNGKDRVREYLRRVPSVRFGGYFDMREFGTEYHDVFVNGKDLRNWRGFDRFFGLNHHIESGARIEEWRPDLECDFDYRIAYDQHVEDLLTSLGLPRDREGRLQRYVAVAFYDQGFYKPWCAALSPQDIVDQLRKVVPHVIVTGGKWDKTQLKGCIDLVGKTTFNQLMAIQRNAVAWVGHAAGNGMLAHHMRVPTVLVWGDNFKRGMRTNWTRPGDTSYQAVGTDECAQAVRAAMEVAIAR